jgi:hypothetical protein
MKREGLDDGLFKAMSKCPTVQAQIPKDFEV